MASAALQPATSQVSLIHFLKMSIVINNKNKAILALIIANIIWGAASPIFKLALQNLPPFTLAFLRFFGAMLLLLPFATPSFWIGKKDWLKLILLSLFGITINITFFFFGLKHAPSINAPIIASSGPVFLYIFSILILHEKPHQKVFLGIMASLIGVLIIIGQSVFEQGVNGAVLGNLFFVLATLGAVGHAIFSKEILHKYKAITITFWSFLIGQLTFLPFFIYEMIYLHPLDTIDSRGWFGLFYGVIFSSAIAYFLFEWGISQLEAQEVGLFTYIDPIAAIVIAIPLLGEAITPIFLAGSILVFLGIFLAEGRIHWHPLHKLRR